MNYDKSRGFMVGHAPGDDLDYGFDWADVLDEGETITQSDWTASTDITLTRETVAGSVTLAFAAGGEDGKYYQLVNEVQTSSGRVYNRMITLICKKTIA